MWVIYVAQDVREWRDSMDAHAATGHLDLVWDDDLSLSGPVYARSRGIMCQAPGCQHHFRISAESLARDESEEGRNIQRLLSGGIPYGAENFLKDLINRGKAAQLAQQLLKAKPRRRIRRTWWARLLRMED